MDIFQTVQIVKKIFDNSGPILNIEDFATKYEKVFTLKHKDSCLSEYFDGGKRMPRYALNLAIKRNIIKFNGWVSFEGRTIESYILTM